MERRTHRIVANGLTHFVYDVGPEGGPAAVLLHGFPDTHHLWTPLAPALTAAGYRVIAPDMRGFGETDMAPTVADYDFVSGPMVDVLEILDALGVDRAELVGHDLSAPVAWLLGAQRPDRFASLSAISVGHTRAFIQAGVRQKLRSLYILVHQMRGLCEALYRLNDWALIRSQASPDYPADAVIDRLRPDGRITAALNWYRANLSLDRVLSPPAEDAFGEEFVDIPAMGVWSEGDKYLTEEQMTASAAYVTPGKWRYERVEDASHWIPYDAPDRLSALLLSHWRGRSID